MKQKPSYTKLRGGYYTPPEIARFVASWAIRSRRDSVLEPGCGDGVFIGAAADRLGAAGAKPDEIVEQLVGYEIDSEEAQKASERLSKLRPGMDVRSIRNRDFFQSCQADSAHSAFDCVLGNPPFVRYQNFPEVQRSAAFDTMRSAGLRPTRLTNAWVPFVVGAALRLKPHGRLGMVLPAELLQVGYTAELRLFLSRFFDQITIIAFRRLAFAGIQQEVCLVLAERGPTSPKGIELVELDNVGDLIDQKHTNFGASGFKPMDHSAEKWTQYFLSNAEIELLREIQSSREAVLLGEVADTDVGVVTGMNDFFVLTDARAREVGVRRFSNPVVSRSKQLAGIIFSREDWEQNSRYDYPVHLLELPRVGADKLPARAKEYVRSGEKRNLHLGYKCSVRKPWYRVPSTYVPSAFLLRQIHHYPKLVANEASATSTDTIHRVRVKKEFSARVLAGASLNSLTFAFSEVLGRSYGGGVLELEPSEADRLPIPLKRSGRLDISGIDKALRSTGVESVLDGNDAILLRDGLGLSKTDICSLRGIWNKLRSRRVERRHVRTPSQASLNMGRHALVS